MNDNDDRWGQADRLFDAALDLSPTERDAFLDQECGDDVELRRLVERLLRGAETQSGWMPPGGALDSPEADDLVRDSEATGDLDAVGEGDRIDGYRLLRKIGEGGMGQVWEADQTEPVRRRVALKLIKWGMDTKQVVARFESERQALALMSHPNIARVFDGGATPGGRPYFVMELVPGDPVTEYCDRNRLSTAERLELFTQICDGVQHAHHKGIIHRDIKPSNVLVAVDEDRPVPKIIDFGVARATGQELTEKTVFTQLGQMIGTPEYMSPEQAEMTGVDIDTRTDVYSLGVLLYELLVGVRPFEAEDLRRAGFDEMVRKIRETDPPRPSTRLATLGDDSGRVAQRRRTQVSSLAKQLRGDLDWIVMRALEKDRRRRYDSPRELAADVRRYRNDEPVEAGPPGTAYRLRKLVKRHRASFVAATIVAVALVVGAGVSTREAIRATRAERAAREEAETARQVSSFLVGLFEVSDPRQSKGETITARQLLEQGRVKIEQELRDQPAIRARMMGTIGNIQTQLGFYDEAEPLLEGALETREREMGSDDVEVARSLRDLARLYVEMGNDEKAEPYFDRARETFERTVGPRDAELASMIAEIAELARRRGRYEESEKLYLESLAIHREVLGDEDDAIAMDLNGLGGLYARQGRYEDAEAAFREALAIRENALGPDHPDICMILSNMSSTLGHLGKDAEAEPLLHRALEIAEKAYGPNHRYVATYISNLAGWYGRQGRMEESYDLFLRAAEINREIFGEDHPKTSIAYKNLGLNRKLAGKFDESERMLRKALEIDERAFGPNHVTVIWDLNTLADLYRQMARYDESRASFERARSLAEATFGPEHPEVARALRGLADLRVAQGDAAAAEEPLRLALALHEKAYGVNGLEVASTLDRLGTVLGETGRPDEALAALERSLEIRAKGMRPDHPALSETLVRVGDVRRATGDLDEAEASYRRALEISEKAYGPDHPDVAGALVGLAAVTASRGDRAAARGIYERALAIRRATFGPDHPTVTEISDALDALR